jgi:transposase
LGRRSRPKPAPRPRPAPLKLPRARQAELVICDNAIDVTFREDASRVRERNAARNLALLRKIGLNLAPADTTLKASLKGKRKYAGWDNTFMATLIAG